MKRAYKGEILELFPYSNKEDPFPEHMWMVSHLQLFSEIFQTIVPRHLHENSDKFQFCQPQGLTLKTEPTEPSCFPFILTSSTGQRLHGFAFIFSEIVPPETLKSVFDTPPSTPIFAPKCICILSHWPFYSAYREWTRDLFRKYAAQSIATVGSTRFINSLELTIINFTVSFFVFLVIFSLDFSEFCDEMTDYYISRDVIMSVMIS